MTGAKASIPPGQGRRIEKKTAGRLIQLSLIGILFVSTILRLVGTNQIFTYVFHPINSIMSGFRLTLAPWFSGEPLLENFFVQLVLFYRGITAPLIFYLNLTIFELFDIQYSEFLLTVPFVFAGLLGLIALYVLGRRLFGVRVGLLAALFMGLASWHVANSRTPQSLVVVFLVQVLIFLFLDKLFEKRTRYWGFLSALILSLEIMGNNGFPFTLLVVGYFLIARSMQNGLDWPQELRRVISQSRFLVWAILPLLALVFQGVLFILAMSRNELLGLLAWSNQHSRYFFDVGPSVIIHDEATPLGLHHLVSMIKSIQNIGIGLNLFFASVCLLSFFLHIRYLWRFNQTGTMVFWYVVLGLPQILFFYTYPEIVATNIAIPLSLLGAKLLSDVWEKRRVWGIVLVVLVLTEGLTGTLFTNLSLAVPRWGGYVPAVAENARNSAKGVRGVKSAALFVRARIPKEDKVYVNSYDLVSELYFDRQLCRCRGEGRKLLFSGQEDRANLDIRWFVEYNPWIDVWGELTGHVEYENWVKRKMRLGKPDEGLHMVAVGSDGNLVLWKVFTDQSMDVTVVNHKKAEAQFDREYMRPDRFFTNRLGGMTFWME